MTQVKMCLKCNRLLSLDVLQCPCGGTEFQMVALNLEEEDNETD